MLNCHHWHWFHNNPKFLPKGEQKLIAIPTDKIDRDGNPVLGAMVTEGRCRDGGECHYYGPPAKAVVVMMYGHFLVMFMSWLAQMVPSMVQAEVGACERVAKKACVRGRALAPPEAPPLAELTVIRI